MKKNLNQSAMGGLEQFATSFRADFRYGPFNIMILLLIFLAGLVAQLVIYPFDIQIVITMLVTAISLSVLFRIFQIWECAIILNSIAALVVYLLHRPESTIMVCATVAGGLLSLCVQIAYQWEKAVILRFGKFLGLKGSGIFFILPVIDKVSNYVDQRIRVTDFNAETTLTKDTVPVNVDAIAFWLVWDAEKSVLEVENFVDAVSLSAQTGLRDAIGKHELGEMLSNRDELGQEIRKILDAKTNAWGITIQSVEIRDIIIPKALEDAMSRQAQAERERQSRIILADAETEIAVKFADASQHYKNNQSALHLRAMNMVFEGMKQKGNMIIVPSTAVETMGLGALGGLTAFDRILDEKKAEQETVVAADLPDEPAASE